MTKKILLGLFVLLLVAISFVAYNFYKNVKEPVSQTAFEAIPQNAALIIKENNFGALFQKISTTNIIWEELSTQTSSAKKLNNKMHFLDSLLNGPFKAMVASKEVLSSLHLSGANNYDFIFYVSIPESGNNDVLQKLKVATKKNPTSRDYDGVAIHTFPYGEGKKIALTHYKNTLAFSFSTVLIEDVIRQLNSTNSLLTDSTFAKVIRTSGHSDDGNIYLNNTNFTKIITQFLNKSTKSKTQKLGDVAKWTELDLTIKPNSIALNGFSFADDKNMLALFKNQQPQDLNMLEVIPHNAAYIYHYGLSSTKMFIENRTALLKSNNEYFRYQKFLDQKTTEYGIDLEVEFLGNITQEAALIITESQSEDFTNNKFVVFKVNDKAKAKANLNSIAAKTNDEPSEPILFNELEIKQLNLSNLFPNLLGNPFPNFEQHYYAFIDDYAVFTNTESALKSFITANKNNKTLENNENFNSFNEHLSSGSNVFIYSSIARSVNLYKTLINEENKSVFDDQLDVFRKFEAVAYQMTTEKNNLYYNNVYLKYNPVYKQETGSLWELALDSTIGNEPQIVKNHKTNAKEIIVQDNANKLYLISNTGKIIWTKQLAEKVRSKFHQIDVYKNNKLQLLFNTKSKIYLLDRNGNNVEKFPVKLPAEAKNEVIPMDYSKNRNYRILIGCNDNMVYNYTVTGEKVKGWEYTSTNSPAKGKMWHFALAGKDYIVIPLANGAIKIIQRSGKDRLKLDKLLPVGNTCYLQTGSSLAKTYIITADTNGTVVKLFLNDKKEALKFDNVTPNSSFSFFDFNGDNSMDYAFTSGNSIFVSDNAKKTLFKNEYETNITHKPLSFKLADHKNGVVTENQIYLIDHQGVVEDGFPLPGSNVFHIADINNDQTMNLVVAHENMLYTYNIK